MGNLGVRTALLTVVLIAGSGVAIAACAPDPPTGGPTPTASPTATSQGTPVEEPGDEPGAGAARVPAEDALDRFLADCAQNVEAWVRGEAVYPDTLPVELNTTATYRAGVAVEGAGEDLHAQLPPAEGFGSAPIDVSCGLSARLTSPDETIDVDETDWVPQPIGRPGEVLWSWRVTAMEPGDHELLLELRPAVSAGSGGYYPGPTTPFVTKVQVSATVVQLVADWWEENWDTVAAIGAAAGAAIIGVIAWLRNLGRTIRGKEPSDETPEETAASTSGGGASSPPEPPAGD